VRERGEELGRVEALGVDGERGEELATASRTRLCLDVRERGEELGKVEGQLCLDVELAVERRHPRRRPAGASQGDTHAGRGGDT
jgi:hypothetical protein